MIIDSLVVIVKPDGWLLCTLDRSGSDGFPCICGLLVVFQRVAKEHLVVRLDHLKKIILSWDIIDSFLF